MTDPEHSLDNRVHGYPRRHEIDAQRDPANREFAVQGMRDGADEAEIEEELEPRGPALRLGHGAVSGNRGRDGVCRHRAGGPDREASRLENVRIVDRA